MLIIAVLLTGLPIGYLVRDRLAGYLTYAVVIAHVFTFQTAGLLMNWVNGDDSAFGRATGTTYTGDTWAYLAVTAVINAAGIGLVTLGQRLRTRRDTRRAAVELQPAA